jgi:hypothetical protein
MDNRDNIARELTALELEMKELQIQYEQYFAGVEKREPLKRREDLASRLRRFANRRITQTNLRFRYQNLATRFHSYAGHWDRCVRLLEEGRRPRPFQHRASPPSPAEIPAFANGTEAIYRQLLEAHKACRSSATLPDHQQFAALLEQQKKKIREKIGDRDLEFQVVTENGKPKIKVRAKP